MPKTKKYIPRESYPPEDYHPEVEESKVCSHCFACGLPKGRAYPKKHTSQTEELECFYCGSTWFEIPSKG